MMFDRDERTVKEAVAAFETGDWTKGLALLAQLKAQLDLNHPVVFEERVRLAKDILERDYSDTRDRIVAEFVQQWRDGDFHGSRDEAYESLEQSCDNANTYTSDAQINLAMSRNDDAYLTEIGEVPVRDGSLQWNALAMYALRADVLEALQHEDIDPNEDPPSEATIECDGCDEWKVCKDGRCEDCTADDEADAAAEKEVRWRLATTTSLTVTSYTSIRVSVPTSLSSGSVTSSLLMNQRLCSPIPNEGS